MKPKLFPLMLSLLAPAGLTHAWLITQTSASIFYVDPGAVPAQLANYASYTITNDTGVAAPDVWASIGGFSTANISLGPFETGVVHLGALAAGQSATAFFYLQGSVTAAPTNYTVSIYSSQPPGVPLASQAFSYIKVQSTISAGANTVSTVTVSPNPPALGGVLTIQVDGATGVVGSNDVIAFTPASYLDWPSNCYQLLSTSITVQSPNAGTYLGRLVVPTPLPSNGNSAYTCIYTFRILCQPGSNVAASPISYISSGAVEKHTTITYVAPPVLPAQNYLVVSKTASLSTAVWPEPVTYYLSVQNTGTTLSTFDSFVDMLPSLPGSPIYVTGTSKLDGTSTYDPVQSASTLTWSGIYYVQPLSSTVMSFDLLFPEIQGVYTNQAIANLGIYQLDTTTDTSDNSPAAYSLLLLDPTPTSTATATPTLTATPTATPTATHSPTSTITPTFTNSATQTPSSTITPTFTHSATQSPTFTVSPSHTATPTWTPTPPPLVLHLYPASPNPSSDGGIHFTYYVAVDSRVEIRVYDIAGEKLRDLDPYSAFAGINAEFWDGKNSAGRPVASGIFIYRVSATSVRDEHKSDFAKCSIER
jgi:hypothetical protein